jgi:REP element-mobilizing transposase RayT
LLAWVIMPDHVHVMLKLGPDSLATVMRNLKGRSSRALGKRFGIVGRTWAPGYHDHALRCTDDVAAVARYVVANPLRAKIVRRLGDYPFWNARWVGGEQG